MHNVVCENLPQDGVLLESYNNTQVNDNNQSSVDVYSVNSSMHLCTCSYCGRKWSSNSYLVDICPQCSTELSELF